MRLWIDNTTLHGAGRCLTGEGRTSRDLRAYLQLATYIVFADHIELGDYEQHGVAELSSAIRSALLNMGLGSDALEIVATSEADYLNTARATAVIAAEEIRHCFRADEWRLLGLNQLDAPSGSHFRPERIGWLATDVEDPKVLEQIANASVAEHAMGAIDYMLATNEPLRFEVRQLIRRTPEWSAMESFQLESFLRSLLNDSLARQRNASYAPAPHRGEIIQRQNLWVVQQLGGIIDNAVERLRGQSLGAPAIIQALVTRSRGDRVGLFREALEFRDQARELRLRFATIQAQFDNEGTDSRFAIKKEIDELARAMRADLKLEGTKGSGDPMTVEFPVGLPTVKLSPSQLIQWANDRFARKRRAVLTDMAKSAAFGDNPGSDLQRLVTNTMKEARTDLQVDADKLLIIE